MDVWICYDYRELTFDADLSRYREIYLVAWSLGVWVASRVLTGHPAVAYLTQAVAINGTPCPIDDADGIPEAIFRGTLEQISEEGMRRFNRRMCGNRETVLAYEQIPPRPTETLREELRQLYQLARPVDSRIWTRAVVSTADRIFPTANLSHYWQGRCPVCLIDAPHFPFYQWTQWNEIWK